MDKEQFGSDLYNDLVNFAASIDNGTLELPEEIQAAIEDIISRHYLINK